MFRIKKNTYVKMFFIFCILFGSHVAANILPFNWSNLNSLNPPTPREFSSQTFDPCSGQIVLFGGLYDDNSLGDTWVFDTVNNSWTEINPTNSPPAREGASMVFNPSNGLVILFGGSHNGIPLSDTWSFDITANLWTEIVTTSSPLARYGASMDFDPSSGQIILFGGFGSSYFNDTWAFNANDNVNTWTILSPLNTPSVRFGATMAFNSSNGQIILFGGNGPNGLLNDTWAFNANENINTWTKLNSVSAPSARYGASLAFNPGNGLMILFGGRGNNDLLNDTWEFDARENANTWMQTNLSASSPSARYGSTMSFEPSGQIILFGGSGTTGDLNDTWSFGIPSNAVLFWKNLNPPMSPLARFSCSFAFDPSSGQIIMFGGISHRGGTYYNDTWAYDVIKNTWTELNPQNPPTARNSARMNFDPCTGKIILFGGRGPNGVFLGDTWIYDSSSNVWTDVTSVPSPQPRNAASMAFDPCSGRMILFGGFSPMGFDYNDTWAYDATANTWTQLTTIGSPTTRDSASMAFDPMSGQIILFGGYRNTMSGVLLNDTWSLLYNHMNNTYTWTELFPTAPPSPRYGVAMKFNCFSGQIILFGGGHLTGSYNDTWAYDGKANTWTQLYPINPPEDREFPGFDFNPNSGEMILFGGVNLPSQNVFDDTQALGMGLSPQIISGNEVSFEVGEFSSYTVTTSGFPNPAIIEVGALPSGIMFVDNGDGTATISGIPNSVGTFTITLMASNGLLPNAVQAFTILIQPVLPPSNFTGVIKKNKFLTQTAYLLIANWDPSPSSDIAFYLIYENGHLVEKISNNAQLIFKTYLKSKNSETNYQIVAVNTANIASEPISIQIYKCFKNFHSRGYK